MDPILTYSEITGRVYIVTKYKRLDGGVIDTREKFDVTDWVERYAKKRNAQTAEENAKLRELITFYIGCLTKGHVDCDSCAFSGEDNCNHGRKVIESAKQVGIEVDDGKD